jgi:hypothetical protein
LIKINGRKLGHVLTQDRPSQRPEAEGSIAQAIPAIKALTLA